MTRRPTVIFDLGGVVLRHDPALAFARVMPEDRIGAFMKEIDYPTWHHAHDEGRTFAEGLSVLARTHPQHVDHARALGEFFQATLPGYVRGTGAVLAELEAAGVRLLALTNFPAEPFDRTYARFGLLHRFEGVLVSGREGLAKPDPAIFSLLLDRWEVDPAEAVFVDDLETNCAAAEQVGLRSVLFQDAPQLREQLTGWAFLRAVRPTPPDRIWHLAERSHWNTALDSGHYPWSTRGRSYHEQGYVHCSSAHQVEQVRTVLYPDLDPGELVLLEIDPDELSSPVLMERLEGASDDVPHIYGPLETGAVVASSPVVPA